MKRDAEPHAWIDCAFIDDGDMAAEDARRVFDAMRERLHGGELWDAVYFDAQAAHKYREGRMSLTRVGNGGEFVVSRSKRDARPLRFSEVPESHVTHLLTANAGDTLVLHDSGEADSPPRPRLTLYFVRDVYRP